MRAKDLAVLLQIPAGKRDELHKILDMLLEEGKISINKRGRYEAVRKENGKKQKEPSREQEKKSKGKREFYLTGTFVGNAKGFGFVEVEGEEEDIFISENTQRCSSQRYRSDTDHKRGKRRTPERRRGS